MSEMLNTDIINNIILLCDMEDIITLSSINKEFNYVAEKNNIYHDYKRLCAEHDFGLVIPHRMPLDYIVDKSLQINTARIIYYAGICSKNKIYDLLEKIMLDANKQYKSDNYNYTNSKYISQYKIVNNIIANACEYHAIEIIKKYYKYCIDSGVTEYCRNYDIICKHVGTDRNFFVLLCHRIRPLCASYNDVALRIILDNYPEDMYISKIIENCDNKLWSKENTSFRSLLFDYISKSNNKQFLFEYLNKMFLYGCKEETTDFFITNNLYPDNTYSIMDGLRNCVSNKNGLAIISWLTDLQTIKLDTKHIISLFQSLNYNKNLLLIKYWKTKYETIIADYYKNIDDKTLHHLIDYNSMINVVVEYIDVNKIINCMFPIYLTPHLSPIEKCSAETLTYISDNIDFSLINDEKYYATILYTFYLRQNDTVFNKYLLYQQCTEKKIHTLVKLLSLVEEHKKDAPMIKNICSLIMNIN